MTRRWIVDVLMVGVLIGAGGCPPPPPCSPCPPTFPDPPSQCAQNVIYCYDEFPHETMDLACFLPASRWNRTALTWKLNDSLPSPAESDQIAAVERALAVWAAASTLTFTRAQGDAVADINIYFVGGSHLDQFPSDPYPFDGEGLILGHAFAPSSRRPGDVHIDAAGLLTLGPAAEGEFVLDAVLLHEIGHALGLGHLPSTGDPNSPDEPVMAPRYHVRPDMQLSGQDETAIRDLYGSLDPLVEPLAVLPVAECDPPPGNLTETNSDTDGDRLPDAVEIFVVGTDFENVDTDGDGVSDYDEVFRDGTPPNARITADDPDADGDFLPLSQEMAIETEPSNPDTDGDGLLDGIEVFRLGTNPLKADTDDDQIDDFNDPFPTNGNFFIVDETGPTRPVPLDCNGNHVPDAVEIANGLALDCNGNLTLDSCEIDADPSKDCNGNRRPDECDVTSGESCDANGNGRPDGCEQGNVCADGDACTTDRAEDCVCVHIVRTDCDDGLFCNGAEVCAGGDCTPGTSPCAANQQCDEVKDECVSTGGGGGGGGGGGPPGCQNDAGCGDGVFCNGVETCVGGACVPGTNPCASGVECANVCNEAADNCFVAAATPCTDDGNLCTNNRCDGAGACVLTNNALPCNDGNACTTNDACSGGVCIGGAPPNCDDGNVCTDDLCDAVAGCVRANNSNSCNDGDACTTNDTCSAGSCVGGPPPNCNDGNPCTTDGCNAAGGCFHANNSSVCDDGHVCTSGDVCVNGVCTGTPIGGCVECATTSECGDANGCTTDTCQGGRCVFTNNTNACNDSNACTTNDACSGGVCVGGAAPNCNDGRVCTDDSCDPVLGCRNVNNTSPCSDGNACTIGDVCFAGGCVSGPPRNCDDDQFCTGVETCVGGTCVAGANPCAGGVECANVCNEAADNCFVSAGTLCTDDGNVCTDNRCNGAGACATTNNALACNDGLFCNGADTCANGACATHAGSPCTPCEQCAEGSGCTPTSPFTLTLCADNLTGTNGADVFTAPLRFDAGSGTQLPTLQSPDRVSGLGGGDTLDAAFNSTATVTPTSITSIETINLTNFALGAATLSAVNVSGVDTYRSVNSTGDLIISNIQEHVDFGLTSINDLAVDLSLRFALAGTTSGVVDAITGTLSAVNAGTVSIQTAAANGFETLRLVSTGPSTNALAVVSQITGTSLATCAVAGAQALQLRTMPATIHTYDASTMTGGLTLGNGTSAANYVSFASVDVANITGGSGDDTFIFGGTLNGADVDQAGEKIDGGAGTDVVQASFGASIGTALPFPNIEELRFNATANGMSLNVGSGNTALKSFTNDADGAAHTVTLLNAPHSADTVLNFRGNNTQAAQRFDAVTYTAAGVAGLSDALTVNINNRGTALNSNGAANQFTVGTLTADNVEILTVAATDGPVASFGLSATGMTSFTITAAATGAGSSSVTMPSLGTTSGADSITTINASGVTGNFAVTAAVADVANGASITLGTGNDTLSIAGSGGVNVTISAGSGDDTITGTAQRDIINGDAGADMLDAGADRDAVNGGAGNDTLNGGAGRDTLTGGPGADTFRFDNSAESGSPAAVDLITDWTDGADFVAISGANVFGPAGATGLAQGGGAAGSLAPVANGSVVVLEVVQGAGPVPVGTAQFVKLRSPVDVGGSDQARFEAAIANARVTGLTAGTSMAGSFYDATTDEAVLFEVNASNGGGTVIETMDVIRVIARIPMSLVTYGSFAGADLGVF